MKNIVVLIAIIFMAVTVSKGQDHNVSFPQDEISVDEAFDIIKVQTGLRFSYSNKSFDAGRKVHFDGSEISVAEALNKIFEGSGFHYTVQGMYVIVQEGEIKPLKSRRDVKPSLPTYRNGDTYVRMNMDAHNNVNRRRMIESPVIQVVDTTTVKADTVRTENTDMYTSFFFPVESYTERVLPRYLLKSNLLHGLGTLTPNIGVEFGLASRTSLEIHGAINPWRLKSKMSDNKKLAHLFIRPEFRYWLCERFNGHFFGVHAFFAHYNVGSYDIPMMFEKKYRYDGIAVGGGFTYGYHLPFHKRWGVEFNVGLGAMWMDYDRFDCAACEKSSVPKTKTYFGPTRAGVTLVFNIK